VLFSTAIAQDKPNFEAPFSSTGNIQSFIYFRQDNTYFIDTEVGAQLDVIRYKRFYFGPYLSEETDMGRKYGSNMVFDPNRGHWTFGLMGRLELNRRFFEARIHHECFHDIGRWQSIDYSIFWNKISFGAGSINYFPKFRIGNFESGQAGIEWTGKLNYYLLASFFAPQGSAWQKNQIYFGDLTANLRYALAHYRHLEFDIESNNYLASDKNSDIERRHGLSFDFTLYGDKGALTTYFGYWPYDTVKIRNRESKAVFGIHLFF
jgi:hypothetical protein